MNRAAKITVGCLLAPVGLFVLGLLVLLAARGMGVPETRVAERSLEQEIPKEYTRTALERSTGVDPEAGLGPERLAASDVVRVELDLEEGMFTLRPGPADGGIQVEAEYDEASYELEQEYDLRDGVPVYRLRFRSKVHWLRRLAEDGSFDSRDMAENRVDVVLPLDTPMQLKLEVSKAEATDLDVSGLSLLSIETRLRMGEFALVSREPNPLVMEFLKADVGMGEVDLEGLGNLNPERVLIQASMGELRVDLGDALVLDTVVDASMRMGEMTLRVPDNVLWHPDSRTKALLGEVEDLTNRRQRTLDPELAPRLRLDAQVTMGALVLREFRAADRPVPSTVR